MVNFQCMDHYSMEDLLRIMELLRAPEGCPWDREQTHQSIRRNMLEEAYEVAEAIDNRDTANLKEELGDVLLQVVFHASLAEDTGRFDLDAVADGICKKMIFRHPHVFGSASADTTEEVLSNWDTLKREEKGIENDADALRAVARTLPALWRAEKVLKKAAKAGFAWPDISGAMDKLAEEQEELRVAVAEHTNIREELGDVLFAAAAVARYAGIDPEQALQEATDKYISRFACMERSAAEQGRSIAGMRLDEMIQAWNHAKQKLQQDTQEDKNNE